MAVRNKRRAVFVRAFRRIEGAARTRSATSPTGHAQPGTRPSEAAINALTNSPSPPIGGAYHVARISDAAVRYAPLALFAVMALLVLGSSWSTFGTAFLGRYYVDAWGTQWFYWFTEQALLGNDDVATTSMFFYPWGKDIYAHTGGNVLDAMMAIPFRWCLGPVVGYNTFVVAILATNAWAMRRLLGELKLSDTAAWASAVLFAFNPYVLTEIRDGRPTQALLLFVLLFWTFWLRAGERWSAAVLSGVFLALTGLTYWYYALLTAPAAALVFLFDRGPGSLRHRLVAAALAAALVAPFAFGMVTAENVPGTFDASLWSATTWSPKTADGLSVGILAFDPIRRMSGFWIEDLEGNRIYTPEWVSMVRVQWVLAGLGLLFAGRRTRVVGLALLVPALIIAIGPEFHGVQNTPYLLAVKGLRVLQRLWWPARALIFVHIGIAVLAAAAFDRLAGWPRSRLALIGMVTVSWLADLGVATISPMGSWPSAIPAVYSCLAKDRERAAILELPYAYAQAHLYYQTTHGHPIFGGMIEDNPIFTPAPQREAREKNSFVRGLIQLADGEEPDSPLLPADKAALGELGYRWVLLDKLPYRNPAPFPGLKPKTKYLQIRLVLDEHFGRPVFEDDDAALWAPWGGDSPCETKKVDRGGRRFRQRSRTIRGEQ